MAVSVEVSQQCLFSVSLQEHYAFVSTRSKPDFSCLKEDINPQTQHKYSQAFGVTSSSMISLPVDVSEHHSESFTPAAPSLFRVQRRLVANLPFVSLDKSERQKNATLSGEKTEARSRVSKTPFMILDPPTQVFVASFVHLGRVAVLSPIYKQG